MDGVRNRLFVLAVACALGALAAAPLAAQNRAGAVRPVAAEAALPENAPTPNPLRIAQAAPEQPAGAGGASTGPGAPAAEQPAETSTQTGTSQEPPAAPAAGQTTSQPQAGGGQSAVQPQAGGGQPSLERDDQPPQSGGEAPAAERAPADGRADEEEEWRRGALRNLSVTPPETVRIAILNASGKPGRAGMVAFFLQTYRKRQLEDKIGKKISVVNLSNLVSVRIRNSVIYYRPGNLKAALLMAQMIPGKQFVSPMGLRNRDKIGIDVEIQVGMELP